IDDNMVIWGLIGVNAVVFCFWQLGFNERARGDSRLLRFMSENFLLSVNSVMSGRWWTMLTCNFSHNEVWHLGLNMFMLYTFGPAVMPILGPMGFLSLYVIAGLSSSVASLLF
ncbi:hypothetical protein BDK51DRAFT_13696, partial [Blyttiomyces helicus]